VDTYFKDLRKEHIGLDQPGSNALPKLLNRNIHEKAWDWVTTHPDIRVFDGTRLWTPSLPELEELERTAVDIQNDESLPETQQDRSKDRTLHSTNEQPCLSSALSSLGSSLRERLTPTISPTTQKNAMQREPSGSSTSTGADQQSTTQSSNVPVPAAAPNANEPQKLRGLRYIPESIKVCKRKFDELPSPIKAPRIFASQNRVWQAITGHPIDLKKLPSMEFICLCVIATHGSGGITQPELVKITGQDKRSVPKRTDELARKGYIEKKPIQHGKMRTSLCVHKRFVKGSHYLIQPQSVEDVFGVDKFVPSGFVFLLHKLLSEVSAVPTRDLRPRLVSPHFLM
jgi:hypothetical protein